MASHAGETVNLSTPVTARIPSCEPDTSPHSLTRRPGMAQLVRSFSPPSRRRFLGAVTAGVAALAAAPLGRATAARPARVILDPARTLATLDRRLFGSFLEHIGRAIYGGIFEPNSRLADARGFRKDVLAAIRGLGVPLVRYPGGNFVSGYNWRDGVGPVKDRPRVLDRAWNSIETNHFGTNEFLSWCKAA